MAALTLCADRKCVSRGSCFRYTADPLETMGEMLSKRTIHVEASLRHPLEDSCSKYWPIRLTITEPKTYYEISFQN